MYAYLPQPALNKAGHEVEAGLGGMLYSLRPSRHAVLSRVSVCLARSNLWTRLWKIGLIPITLPDT